MKITATFRLERETKGAVRYQELNADGDDAIGGYAVGTLYIRKSAFEADKFPQKFKMELTEL